MSYFKIFTNIKFKKINTKRKSKNRSKKINLDYINNKEKARELVIEKLEYWNQFYNFKYNRIAIRDTKTRWGSCSSESNLNFNYRIIHLPETIADYLIVHELCHLEQMNHSINFWNLVAQQIPDYAMRRDGLRKIKI